MTKKIPVIVKLICATVICAVFTLLFQYLTDKSSNFIFKLSRDIFFILSSQLLIMFVCAPIIFMIFKKNFDPRSAWFREKHFENKLYSAMKIRKWKDKFPVYDTSLISIKQENLHDTVMQMCHAEIVHESIAVLAFLPLFAIRYGVDICLLICSSVIFAIIHLAFAAIQRYNRPRIIKLIEMRKK